MHGVTRQILLGLFSAWLGMAVTPVVAQWHAHGYVGAAGDRVFVFDGRGGVQSTVVASGFSDVVDLTMDVDNRLVILVQRDQQKLVQFDPWTLTVVNTLFAGAPLQNPVGITVDHNGDYYITDAGARSIFRLTSQGKMQTVVTSTLLDHLDGGIRIDQDTGELLVLNSPGSLDRLYRIRRDGSRQTTVGHSFDGRYGFDVHIPSWDIYSTSCCHPFHAALRVLRLGQSQPEDMFLQEPIPSGAMCVRCDRSSAIDQRLVLSPAFDQGGIWFVDLTSRVVTSLNVVGAPLYAIDFLRGRNVQSVHTSPERWEIRLSFPGEAGAIYAVLLGLNGTRPPLWLNDGRKINLVWDDLAQFTLFHELSYIFWNNHGYLDASGEARAYLDVSWIRNHVRGLRLFLQAVTVSPSQPQTIQTIPDPVPLVIEGY